MSGLHLAERGEFDDSSDSPFGLVKVGNRIVAKKKVKEGRPTAAEAPDE